MKTSWNLTVWLLRIKTQQSFGVIYFSFCFGTQQLIRGWGDSPHPHKPTVQRNQRIRRRAGPGGASGRRTAPQEQPGTGRCPRRWPPPPHWCWRPGRTISPRLPPRSASDSPAEEEEIKQCWHKRRRKCNQSVTFLRKSGQPTIRASAASQLAVHVLVGVFFPVSAPPFRLKLFCNVFQCMNLVSPSTFFFFTNLSSLGYIKGSFSLIVEVVWAFCSLREDCVLFIFFLKYFHSLWMFFELKIKKTKHMGWNKQLF